MQNQLKVSDINDNLYLQVLEIFFFISKEQAHCLLITKLSDEF